MLSGALIQLRDKPLDFMKGNSVAPANNPRGLGFAHIGKGRWDNHFSMKTEGRIAMCSLAESQQYVGGYDLTAEVLTPENANKLATTSIPMWFLPWHDNHLVEIQIPPKIPSREGRPTISRSRADARADLSPPVLGRQRATAKGSSELPEMIPEINRDPDLFFTAAINGCSVFATGDPRSPRVYHGGTTEKMGEGEGVRRWRDLFREIDPQAYFSGDFGEVNKTDYTRKKESKKPKYFDPGSNKPLYDNVTDTSSAYKKFLKQRYTRTDGKKDILIHHMRPWGCVFGIRDVNGNWSFYLQENCSITYTLGRDTSDGYQAISVNKTTTKCMSVKQFFPSGGGGVMVRHQMFSVL